MGRIWINNIMNNQHMHQKIKVRDYGQHLAKTLEIFLERWNGDISRKILPQDQPKQQTLKESNQ